MSETESTQLTFKKGLDGGTMCRTIKAQPTSRFFLPDQLQAVEVDNMHYDEDFNQLTITGQPGQLAVAYCEKVGKPKFTRFQAGNHLDYDAIYIFEIEEGDLYQTLPIAPGKVITIVTKAGQRFILPGGTQDILVANRAIAKPNQQPISNSFVPEILLDEVEGKQALAVGVHSNGTTVILQKPARVACIIATETEPCLVVFELPSAEAVLPDKDSAEIPANARRDLNIAPNILQNIIADEESVFVVPKHLTVRHCQNATYNKDNHTVTIHRHAQEKTRVFFAVAIVKASLRDIGITEFNTLKTPANPYLPPITAGEKLVIKTKQGAKFTVPGEERNQRECDGLRITQGQNIRMLFEEGRQIIEIGVSDDGKPLKSKSGKKATLVVDLTRYDDFSEAIQTPTVATYVFQY